MTTAIEAGQLPFYLTGNFAPVADEVTSFDLPVEGAIPPELRGVYLRNGPNPRSGDPGHWFLGDGMIHGVRLGGGKALWYRNRWVSTRALEEGAELVAPDGTVDRTVAKANTNVIEHAGRIFALVESSYPTEITRELETIGVCDFEGRLTTAMTAHPKRCSVTGELHFFGYGFLPPFLTYHRLDVSGRLVESEEIDVPGPTMMHDFAITDRHVIFMDLPVVFRPDLALEGRFPYAWSEQYGARLGVKPRQHGAGSTRWFAIEPCYVFHPLNAFAEGDRILVDVARYERLWADGPETFPSACLHRWEIDLKAGGVRERRLDDRPIEFPRVDDRRVGLPHRYGYAVANFSGVADPSAALVKYDLASGRTETHDFGAGRVPAEGVMVPASDRAGEDDGWVLLYVYDRTRNASDLVILDGAAFTGPPVAVVHLPQRVPFGFHGNWISGA